MAVTDETIEKIKLMIVSGELRPGDRLLREPDLAERRGLSRSSLREAERAPSLAHILDVRKGDGTVVTSLQPALLMEALGFIVDYHRDDNVLLFHEVPRILEPAATAMAATSMPDADVVPAGRLLHNLGDNPASQISWRRPRVPPADRRRLRYSGALVAGRESFRSHAAGAEGGAG